MNQTQIRTQYVRRFKDSGAALAGLFELTGRCNLDCKMCYVHTKSNADFLKTERSGDWWIQQIDAACNKGMLFATLSGGECLLHPDFRRIYLHLLEKRVYTQINTTGLLLTEDNIEFLKQNRPFELQVTLYGASNDAYKEVTGVPAFEYIETAILRPGKTTRPHAIIIM